MPARMLGPEGEWIGMSASEDAGSRRGVDCDVPHWLGRRTNHPL